MSARAYWVVSASNPAFGRVQADLYIGSERGAIRAAARLARKCGFNWSPAYRPAEPMEIAQVASEVTP